MSLSWSLLSQGVRQAVTFVIVVLLARLLTPRDFGLVAMVTALAGFAALFAELGISAALVQKKEITDEQLSSVFWLNLLCGILLSALFIFAAPFVSQFFREPRIEAITIALSLSFILNSFAIVHRILATKSLRFRTLAAAEIISTFSAGLLAVMLALNGYGYWSLVWQTLFVSIITNIVLWTYSPWRPMFRFRLASIRELLHFGANVMGTHTLEYWTRNIDNILIGRFLGSEALGFYSRAYSVLVFRINSLPRIVSRVFFPAISEIQDDKVRVKEVFLKTIGVIALITFPMTLGLFATAERFVLALFGEKWLEMVPVLRALCLLGLTTAAGSLTGSIYLSQGKANLHFRVGMILKTAVIAGIVVGLRWGIIGVALCFGMVTLVNVYASVRIAGTLIGLRFGEYLKVLVFPLGCSLAMAVPVWLLPRGFPVGVSPWLILAGQVMLGSTLYVALVHLLRVDGYLELANLVKGRMPKSAPAAAP
jgi:PST family polysaccharide transporter